MKDLFEKLRISLTGNSRKPAKLSAPCADSGPGELELEMARIDPAITAEQLLAGLQSKAISGSAFNRLAGSRTVDVGWLKQQLAQSMDRRDWHLMCNILPFLPGGRGPDVNLLLGLALRASFDDIVYERPSAVWGTPELIVDAMAEDDPRVVPDLAHICCLPPNVAEGWYLDYRKAVDAIQHTNSMPVAARIAALQALLGRSEVDAYVQEAIERLSSQARDPARP
jgi:hypothetical protein